MNSAFTDVEKVDLGWYDYLTGVLGKRGTRAHLGFAQILSMAIKQNYLIIGLVSSHTQGRIKSLNLPYGVGKTTLAMWCSYLVNAKPGTSYLEDPYYNPYDLSIPEVKANWDLVFNNLTYNVVDLAKMVMPGSKRRKIIVWDDAAATAPAEQGVPKAIYKLKGYLTTTRPNVACILLTASNRNEIVAPIRKLIMFELIVAERGVYEVQRVKFYKNYRNPDMDLCKLEYLEEGTFPPLPEEVQERYDEWREKEKQKLFPDIVEELEKWLKLRTEEKYSKNVVEGNIVKFAQGRYAVIVPPEIGKQFHRRRAKIVLPEIRE